MAIPERFLSSPLRKRFASESEPPAAPRRTPLSHWWLRLRWAAVGAAGAVLVLWTMPWRLWTPQDRPDDHGSTGGVISGPWRVSSVLWPGHDRPGDEGKIQRKPNVQQLLLLTSSQPARLWAARISGPGGVQPLLDDWPEVAAVTPRAVLLAPPVRTVFEEVFVVVFVAQPASGFHRAKRATDLQKLDRATRALLAVRLPVLIRAVTPELRMRLEKELTEQLVPLIDREVRVGIRHWTVVN